MANSFKIILEWICKISWEIHIVLNRISNKSLVDASHFKFHKVYLFYKEKFQKLLQYHFQRKCLESTVKQLWIYLHNLIRMHLIVIQYFFMKCVVYTTQKSANTYVSGSRFRDTATPPLSDDYLLAQKIYIDRWPYTHICCSMRLYSNFEIFCEIKL